MFSLLKKYELRGAKRRVRLFNRFQIESVLKIAPYHTLKFGGIGKLQYLCFVVQRKAALFKGKKTLAYKKSLVNWGLFCLRGTSDGIAGDGGTKGLRLFLPFYFFTFLLLISIYHSQTFSTYFARISQKLRIFAMALYKISCL